MAAPRPLHSSTAAANAAAPWQRCGVRPRCSGYCAGAHHDLYHSDRVLAHGLEVVAQVFLRTSRACVVDWPRLWRFNFQEDLCRCRGLELTETRG